MAMHEKDLAAPIDLSNSGKVLDNIPKPSQRVTNNPSKIFLSYPVRNNMSLPFPLIYFWSLQVVSSLTTWRSPSHTRWRATSLRSRPSSSSSSPAFLSRWELSPSSASTWALTWWAAGKVNFVQPVKPFVEMPTQSPSLSHYLSR